MFVGHYAVAIVLVALLPGVDPLVPLVGVALPDLLLGVLVLAGVERVDRDEHSPLWTDIEFAHYPYSHSFVLGAVVWTLLALPVTVLVGVQAGLVFVLAAVSHWLLDAAVHDGDLPVLGFGHDRAVGLGLWRRPRFSFLLEYLLFAGATVAVLPRSTWVSVLVVGAAANLLIANASFAVARTNPVYHAIASRVAPRIDASTPSVVRTLFALEVIGGYVTVVAALWFVLGG